MTNTVLDRTSNLEEPDDANNYRVNWLIDRIAQTTGHPKKIVRDVLNAVPDTIGQALDEGRGITWTGWGTFSLRERTARKGVHPQTGEAMDIPATTTPGMSFATRYRERFKAHATERAAAVGGKSDTT